MQPCVYILASRRNGTLYTGVTSDLSRRASEHRRDIIDGFSKRYGVHKLVYVEFYSTMAEAILREKLMPSFPRKRESRRQDRSGCPLFKPGAGSGPPLSR